MNHDLSISILIPLYGESEFISQAINSIRSQIFPGEWEIVIVYKDAKNTLDSIKHDPRIVRVEQKTIGLPNALNEGLVFCKFPYIARLDSDDVMTQHRIEHQLRQFQIRPDLVAIGGQALIIDEKGFQLGSILYPIGSRLVDWALDFSSPLAHPATTIRKSALIQAGGYRSGFLHAEDHDLWVRLRLFGKVDNLKEFVLFYRRHRNQLTEFNIDKTIMTSASIMAISNSKEPSHILNYENPSQIIEDFPDLVNQYYKFMDFSRKREYIKLLELVLKKKETRVLFFKKFLLKTYHLINIFRKFYLSPYKKDF